MPVGDLAFIAIVGAFVFLGAIINGAVGFGFALVAVAALTFVIEAREAVIVMSVVAPILSSLQVIYQWSHRQVFDRLRLLLAGGVIGSLIGVQLLVLLPGWVLSLALGGFALYYVGTSLRRERAPMSAVAERRLAPAVGVTAGIMNGTLGASGPVLGSYLHAIGLRTRDFAFAISVTFAIMGFVRLGGLVAVGAYANSSFMLGLGLIVPAMVGQRIGFRLQRQMDRRHFERALFAVLLVAGINLLIKGVGGALA